MTSALLPTPCQMMLVPVPHRTVLFSPVHSIFLSLPYHRIINFLLFSYICSLVCQRGCFASPKIDGSTPFFFVLCQFFLPPPLLLPRVLCPPRVSPHTHRPFSWGLFRRVRAFFKNPLPPPPRDFFAVLSRAVCFCSDPGCLGEFS